MPLYEYECLACGKEFEDYKRIDERLFSVCRECGGLAKQVLTATFVDKRFPFVTDDFDGTPIEVRSREHYRSLCKQHGVYAPHEFGIGWNIGEV